MSSQQHPQEKIDQFFAKVRATMTLTERDTLPSDTEGFVDAHFKKALENVDEFKGDLGDLIKFLFNYSSPWERFIRNPENGETLFVDGNDDIVSLGGVEFGTIPKGLQREGTKYISSYKTCTVLTGKDKGNTYTMEERPLPYLPEPSS